MAKIRRLDIRPEGDKVFVAINQDTFLELEWQKADEFARALIACARRAEEHAKAQQLIRDGALLLRSGAGFSLSNDPKMRAEVEKEAAWNSDLRRRLPGGIKSEEHVGVPILLQGPPQKH